MQRRFNEAEARAPRMRCDSFGLAISALLSFNEAEARAPRMRRLADPMALAG